MEMPGDEDFPIQKMVEQMSYYDIVPTDMEFAYAWSKAEHELEEIARQCHLLGKAQAARHRVREDFTVRHDST